jgi:hypothetical protein
MVRLWYKQGILYKRAREALAALVSRREGALVGASGVSTEHFCFPEHTASGNK